MNIETENNSRCPIELFNSQRIESEDFVVWKSHFNSIKHDFIEKLKS